MKIVLLSIALFCSSAALANGSTVYNVIDIWDEDFEGEDVE